MPNTDTTYNGWANRETWNVNLWIANDEGLYAMSQECETYYEFMDMLRDAFEGEALAYETPDHVSWNDSGLDIDELNRVTFDRSDD